MPDETQATGNEAPETTADTAKPQPSEASGQVDEAPEATQEQAKVEETDAPETNAEETAQEKLYAGKYKSVEDLEKAYKNAESQLGKQASEKAKLAQSLNESFEEQSYDNTATGVDPEKEALKRDMAIIKFGAMHADADPEMMRDILINDPYLPQVVGYEAKLEYAYLRSQNMSHQKAIAEAEKKGADSTQAKLAEKQVAQVESAKKAEPVDEDSELMNQATSGSPDEREQARKTLIRKHLVNL